VRVNGGSNDDALKVGGLPALWVMGSNSNTTNRSKQQQQQQQQQCQNNINNSNSCPKK